MSTEDKIKEIERLRAEGISVDEAAKTVGMKTSNYYAQRKKLSPAPAKRSYTARAKQNKFIDLPISPAVAPEAVTLIVCSPSQIAAVLRGLK